MDLDVEVQDTKLRIVNVDYPKASCYHVKRWGSFWIFSSEMHLKGMSSRVVLLIVILRLHAQFRDGQGHWGRVVLSAKALLCWPDGSLDILGDGNGERP